MKQLMLLVEESQASKEAKAKGLEYLSFGRYGKNGKQTHAVVKGKLVPIKKPVTPQIATGAAGATPLGLKSEPKVDKYGQENDPDNWWRDAFYARHGKMSKDEAMKLMKIHPDLAKSFKGLFNDYIKKDKSGNYEWPEMIQLGI